MDGMYSTKFSLQGESVSGFTRRLCGTQDHVQTSRTCNRATVQSSYSTFQLSGARRSSWEINSSTVFAEFQERLLLNGLKGCPSCRAFSFNIERQRRHKRRVSGAHGTRDISDVSPVASSASATENPSQSSDSFEREENISSETVVLNGAEGLPSPEDRLKIIVSTALAFVICNMDKVNMSVAIIPMSQHLGWSTSVAGLVQSSFFCGYAMSQLPGGWLAQRFSGRTVLLSGVLLWSAGTAIVPCVATCVPILLLVRLLIGLGEGVAPPAATDLIARSIPKEERSRAVATVFGGLNVGSVAGLVLAPLCIEFMGWESVFYIFGIAGIVWWAAFRTAGGSQSSRPSQNGSSHSENLSGSGPATVPQVKGYPSAASIPLNSLPVVKEEQKVPWKLFFESPAVLALIWAHFCNDWGKYALQSWLPSYYRSALNLDLIHASQIAVLPPVLSVCMSAMAAWAADSLIKKGVDITMVRRIMQTISFLAPAMCLSVVCGLHVSSQPWLVVALLTAGLGLSSFSLAGLYCTHQDISPKYAGILLGITNTAGAIPGFIGTVSTGVLYDLTKSWNYSLFLPAILFYLGGALVWILYASSRPQDFDALNQQQYAC